jgi:hypothetical protein
VCERESEREREGEIAIYCSKDCQVHTVHRKRGGLAIKAIIDYSNAHTNTNVTE